MRNKQFIIGIIVITVIAVVAIFSILLIPSKPAPEEEGNPFGETGAAISPFDQTANQLIDPQQFMTGSEPENESVPVLRLLTSGAVSGAGIHQKDSQYFVRYAEKHTGNLYETPVHRMADPAIISQRTLLRVGQSLWSPNGSSTLMLRYNDTANTLFSYLGTLQENKEANAALNGRPLSNDIISAAFSPSSTYIAYLIKHETGSTLFIEHVLTGTRREVWDSPLTNLTVRWDGPDIVVYLKPSSQATGVAWLIEQETGAASVLTGNKYALAVKTNRAGTEYLYSFRESVARNTVHSLRVQHMTDGSDPRFLPMATLVEKCVWGPETTRFVYCAVPRNPMHNTFLEEMYQGKLLTDDVLWRFNVDTGEATRLVDLYEETKVRMDAENIMVTDDNKFLVFTTRGNDYLWALRLP